MKSDTNPKEFAGYWIARDRERRVISLRMTQHVLDAVETHFPEILRGERPSRGIAKGLSLQKLEEKMVLGKERPTKLNRLQKKVQQGTGCLKYPERVLLVMTLPLHLLSRVMSNPPPEAYLFMALAFELAYDHRYDSITYGGVEDPNMTLSMRMDVGMDKPSTSELRATADATWGTMADVYALIVQRSGGPVAHSRKNVGVVCDASYDSESVASTKCAHRVIYAQEIERAMGGGGGRPTVIGTDSSSNLAVARNQGAATLSRHSLRRWAALYGATPTHGGQPDLLGESGHGGHAMRLSD